MSEVESVRSALESLVAEMRDAGRLDSSGHFTIDASKALEKIRRFQVERPEDFVLWLAAAAVMSEAKELVVTRGLDQICVEFDGQQFLPGELQLLLEEGASLLPGRLGHLAFALTAALASEPDEIIVESFDQRLRVRPGSSQLSRVAEPLSRLRFLVASCHSSRWDQLQVSHLHKRIPRSLLKVAVNQQAGLGYILSADLVHGLHDWRGTEPNPLMDRMIGKQPCTRHSLKRPWSVLMTLDSWHRQGDSEVLFLYDGLLFGVPATSSFCFRAIVCWPELQLNLSRTALVESHELRQVVTAVQNLAGQLAQDFVRSYVDLKPALRHLAQAWLESMAQLQHLGVSQESNALLQRFHRPGLWLEREEPGKLIKELLQKFVEPPLRRAAPAPPSSFWASLAGLFRPGSAPDPQLDSLREGMAEKKKWRELLVSLLAAFDAESTIRLGLSAAVSNPDWLVLEGLTPDGTHVILQAEEDEVNIHCFYPKGWKGRAFENALEVPAGWRAQVQPGPAWQVRFSGGSWRAPEALVSLLECVLASRRRAQSQELLACPGCRQGMEKIVLDIVFDRCEACQCLWLDYAELEWLLKSRPDFRALAPPEGGRCPRCDHALHGAFRSDRQAAQCSICRGVWLSTDSFGEMG